MFSTHSHIIKLILLCYEQKSITHSSAIKSLECVIYVQVKREDDHTAEDIVGSDSVIVNNHDGIENKNKDDDDAASVNVQEEQLPVPADCCAGSKSDVQHPLQQVKTTTGVRRKPSNQDASAPQKRKNLEEKKLFQPALLNQIVLTIGASNSFNSKRSLDTAICLSNISRINHWDIGAAK